MAIWQTLGRILKPDDTVLDELFSLGDRLEPGIPGARHADIPETDGVDPWLPDAAESGADGNQQEPPDSDPPAMRRPVPVRQLQEDESAGQAMESAGETNEQTRATEKQMDALVPDLAEMRRRLERVFHLPQNANIAVQKFAVGLDPPLAALAAFTDGLASTENVHKYVLLPLMRLVQLDDPGQRTPLAQLVAERLVPGNVTLVDDMKAVVRHVLDGDTVVFLAGSKTAIAIETKGWSERSVSEPQTELTVAGPHDAFNENLLTNTALIRRRLHTPDLIAEMHQVGDLSNIGVAVLFIHGLTNPKLVAEVRRRLKAIKTDHLADTGLLQQFMEDSPFSVVPAGIRTERPDRAAAFLAEGSVVLLVNTSPFAYVVPVTLWSMIHSPEDAYLRWPSGTFLRWMRFFAMFTTLLIPSFYIAVTNFHPEMIPTDLLLAIASARERVPFPVIVEVLLMELSFELIREAGVRVPSVIGQTLGIVGALILGQAAVAASIVSPILVIVVAITGLASFAIPYYALGFSMRILRFVYIALAATVGFFGIAIGLCWLVVHLVSLRSFGVPFFSPVAPNRPGSNDLMTRKPAFVQQIRPLYLRPAAGRRQPPYVRTWHPATPQDDALGGRSNQGGDGSDGHKSDGQ